MIGGSGEMRTAGTGVALSRLDVPIYLLLLFVLTGAVLVIDVAIRSRRTKRSGEEEGVAFQQLDNAG